MGEGRFRRHILGHRMHSGEAAVNGLQHLGTGLCASACLIWLAIAHEHYRSRRAQKTYDGLLFICTGAWKLVEGEVNRKVVEIVGEAGFASTYSGTE